MSRLLFSFILLVFFSSGAQSQNNKNQASKESRRNKIITYNLSQVQSQQQLTEVQAELLKFKHVTNVTVTPFGQEETITLKIFVSEVIKNEGDDCFNQAGLKKMLSAKGIKPAKMKIEELN